jgi:hypothetical protein
METKKNTTTFTIRVDKSIKDRFLKISKLNEENGSQLLRKFMKEYLTKNSQSTLKL